MDRKIVTIIGIFAIVIAMGLVIGLSGVIDLTPPAGPKCVVGGCSGELCVDETDNTYETRLSICIWSDSYACYKSATCEVQRDGKCGWTATAELNACLLESK